MLLTDKYQASPKSPRQLHNGIVALLLIYKTDFFSLLQVFFSA